MRLTPDQGELLSALLWQGAPQLQLGPQLGPMTSQSDPKAPPATEPSSPPILMPPELGPPLFGPRPELVIALTTSSMRWRRAPLTRSSAGSQG